MRIQRVKIRGFGALHERELELSGRLSILYGPNEAGKSSVLYFIRAMLYGFPGRTHVAQRGEPQDGGAHGGELELLDEGGNTWRIRRFSRTSEGVATGSKSELLNVTVQDSEGMIQELGQQEIERDLLSGISGNMFRQLFAISLSELQEIRTLQSEEMSRYLFHAGIGGGNGIVQAERKLSQEMDKLFKPRGRVQESAKIIQDIEQLRARLAESGSYLTHYNQVVSELREVDTTLAALEQERQTGFHDLVLYRKAVEIREIWLSWKEDTLELSTLPDCTHFPLDGVNRWEMLREEYRSLDLRLTRVQKAAADISRKIKILDERPLLDELGPKIELLWSKKPIYVAAQLEQEKLKTEFSIVEDRLYRILHDIDESWTPIHLESLKVSASQREDIRRMGASFAGYDRRMETLALEQRGTVRTLAAAETSLREARRNLREETERGTSNFFMIKPTGPRETLTLWSKLQFEAERWREARLTQGAGDVAKTFSESQIPKGMPPIYRRLLIGISIMTILLPAVLLWAGVPEAAAASAVLLFISDIYIWWNARAEKVQFKHPRLSGEFNERGADGEQEVSNLISELIEDPQAAPSIEQTFRRGLGSDHPHQRVNPVQMEARLRELRKMMDDWQAWQQRLQRLTAEVNTAEERVSQQNSELLHIQRVIHQEEKRFLELEQQWDSWLQERFLPNRLSPEAVMDILGWAEQGIELIRQLKSLAGKLEVLSKEAVQYEEECLFIAREMGMDEEAAGTYQLEAIYNEWVSYQGIIQERKILSSRFAELLNEEMEIADERNSLQGRMNDLLKAGGVMHEEDFLRLGAAAIRSVELERNIRHGEVVMFSGWSVEDREQLEFMLEKSDALDLERICQEKEERAVAEEMMRDELQERRGRLLQEKESLEQKAFQEDTLQQLKERQSALKNIIEQYAVRSIGTQLISRTRKFYEEEKQPHVLRLASGYLSYLTGGSYIRVLMRMGDQLLLAEQKDGTVVESSRLSRGTAEQLYLAMRLALAELMPHNEKTPMVFDDIFVNFDSDRLSHALELLAEVSSKRQIILMTCHEHVAKRIKELHPSAQFVHM